MFDALSIIQYLLLVTYVKQIIHIRYLFMYNLLFLSQLCFPDSVLKNIVDIYNTDGKHHCDVMTMNQQWGYTSVL